MYINHRSKKCQKVQNTTFVLCAINTCRLGYPLKFSSRPRSNHWTEVRLLLNQFKNFFKGCLVMVWARFRFWVDKSYLKMPKMVHFGEILKTWSLRSNSVTRQVSFNRPKISGKCQNSNETLGNFQTTLPTSLFSFQEVMVRCGPRS